MAMMLQQARGDGVGMQGKWFNGNQSLHCRLSDKPVEMLALQKVSTWRQCTAALQRKVWSFGCADGYIARTPMEGQLAILVQVPFNRPSHVSSSGSWPNSHVALTPSCTPCHCRHQHQHAGNAPDTIMADAAPMPPTVQVSQPAPTAAAAAAAAAGGAAAPRRAHPEPAMPPPRFDGRPSGQQHAQEAREPLRWVLSNTPDLWSSSSANHAALQA